MNRILLNTRFAFIAFIVGMASTVCAQNDDFTTRTKVKVNYKIDSRFSVYSDLELRTKKDASTIDRWGLSVGGDYRVNSFLKLGLGYETH